MNKYILLYAALFFAINGFSQGIKKWSVLFGTEMFTGLVGKNLPEDLPNRIVQTQSDNYYITGTNSLNNGDANPNTLGSWIAKINADGKLLWWKIGDPNFYTFSPGQLVALKDDGALVSGNAGAGSSGFDTDGIILFRYDKNGELIAKKSHQIKSFKSGDVVAEQGGIPYYTWETSDGRIGMIASITIRIPEMREGYIYNGLHEKFWLIYFTPELDIISSKIIDIPHATNFDNINQTDDSFLLVYKEHSEGKKVIICKFDKEGNKIWEHNMNFNFEVSHCDIARFKTGEVIFFANIYDGKNETDMFIKLDSDGNKISEITLPDCGFIMHVVPIENDYVVYASIGIGEGTFFIKRQTTDGGEIWKKIYGQKRSANIDITRTNDGGFAMIAYTKDYNANYVDCLIIKTDSSGISDMVPKTIQKQQ